MARNSNLLCPLTFLKVLGKTWAAEAAGFIAKLKTRTLGGNALIHTDHHLNLLMGTSALSRLEEPTALLELTVNRGESVGQVQSFIYLFVT